MKREIRTIGIDDSPFVFKKDQFAFLVGVIYRGNIWPEGVEMRHIEVDGVDSTSAIVDMVKKSRHFDQIRMIFLSGVTFAGLNLADPQAIATDTYIPVVTIVDKKPNIEEMKRALERTVDSEIKKAKLSGMTELREIVDTDSGKRLYIQVFGTSFNSAIEAIELTRRASAEPESVRVAKLFASSLPTYSEIKKLIR